MLPNQRTNVLFVLMTAMACLLPSSLLAQTESDDLNTSELNVDAVEPQIALPEVSREKSSSLRVQTISLGARKESRDGLVQLAQEAVDTTSRRLLSSNQHTPWQMMHALLGLRQEFNILHKDQEVSGLQWIAQGQVFDGDHWFEKTRHGGRAHPYSVPYAFEGHANQMLAVLSMCGLETDHQFQTANGTITIADMIEHAKMTCNTKKDEPTWTLWALSRYLPPDAVWRNESGEVCSIELLVADQTRRPLKGAACGGTHGLFALAHARNVYLREGKPLRGVWLQSENKLRYYINTARRLQNPNGTLSSNYLRTREYNRDFNKRMASAGHVLEFLMLALPQNELNQRWVRRAIETTARDLLNNRKEYVKCSPLYHSVNALNIYLDRVNPREEVPQTAKVASPRTAMVNPNNRRNRTPMQGISQSRVLEDSETAADSKSSSTSKAKADDADADEAGDQKPATLPVNEAASNHEEIHEPLPTTSSAEEGAAKKSVSDLKATSKLPVTGSSPDRQSYRLDRTVTDAIVQQQLDHLESTQNSHWKPTDKNRDQYNDERQAEDAATTRDETDKTETDETEATKNEATKADATDGKDDLIRLKPVTSNSTLQAAGDPLSLSEARPTQTVRATPKAEDKVLTAPLKLKNETPTESIPANDASPTIIETDEPAKLIVTERPSLRSRLYTGGNKANPFTVDRPVTRQPFSIPSTPVSQSRTVAREDAADRQTMTDGQSSSLKQQDSGDSESNDETKQEIQSTEFSTIPAGINDRFMDPEMNPEEWVNRFEVESREIYAQRKQIVNAIGLSSGDSIADIGAGTGLFAKLFSQTVGSQGQVYAIDISPRMITHLEKRVALEGMSNVMVVRNDAMSTQLVTRKVDKAFVCDTYHHFERPDAMLKSIHRALNDAGELVVIDFERIPGQSRDWVIGHVRAGKETFRSEIEASGFEFVKEVQVEGFKENYLLVFRKR
ncbi:MAG: class I SAM-dependent methyltransferase [Fuerstiella sp.]